jgi:hypothetical protein
MQTGGIPLGNDSESLPAQSAYDRPNWDHISKDVVCPLCGYNLRGLSEPRCPECGYQFRWRNLLDPARQRHPYLFEAHPDGNFKSFWLTAFHGLRPRTFWNTLRADEPSQPERLVLYSFLVNVLFLTGIFCVALFCVVDRTIQGSAQFYRSPGRRVIRDLPPPLAEVAILIAWPWLTALALMIFQTSMRQAKIRVVHVFRCIVYSADCMIPAAIVAFISLVAAKASAAFQLLELASLCLQASIFVWLIIIPLFAYRMVVAYGHYLRFPHVAATILATQIIVALFTLTAMCLIYLYA